MDKRLALIAAFVLFACISSVSASCIARSMFGMDPNDFNTSPQEYEEGLTNCWEFGESCCSVEYDTLVGQDNDPIAQLLYQTIKRQTVSPDCLGVLRDISCTLCDPLQSDYIDIRSTYSTIDVCEDFCDVVYQKCGNAYVYNNEGALVILNRYYADSSAMCSDLLNGNTGNVRLAVDEANVDCWDDIPPCTMDDYYELYSDCVAGHRTLSYVLKPTANCNGGVVPPATQTGLACAVDCNPGYYLYGVNQQCTKCPPGSFSLGGGEKIDYFGTDIEELPLEMQTYCVKYDNRNQPHPIADCGWRFAGELVASGRHEDNTESILALHVNMVRDGLVRYSYQVEGEYRYDGFLVRVDHTVVKPMVSVQTEYILDSIDLSKGFHVVEFVYKKDFSISVGEDMATINLLEVIGTSHADTRCTQCSPGHYVTGYGNTDCLECPAGSYANKEGSKNCDSCPEGFYSFQASANCTESPECTEDDYEFLYSACDANNNRMKNYRWVDPHICSGGVSLPNSVQVPCPPCNPGMVRSPITHQCEFCPNGQAREEDAVACHTCSAGTEAIETLTFDTFESWSNGLSTTCRNTCGTPGWRLRETFIDSGADHGHYVNSILRLVTELDEPGTLTFRFSVICEQNCDLFFSDNNGHSGIYYGGPYAQNQFINTERSFTIPAGEATLEWTFIKIDPYNLGRNDRVEIYEISLTRVHDGGAAECTPCEPGTYSTSGGLCQEVPAGFYSEEGASAPVPCPAGTFSNEPGQGACISCGASGQATPDRTDCVVTCQFKPNAQTLPNLEYDLHALARTDEMYGPIYDSEHSDTQAYYLNICSKQHRNHSCYDEDENPIPTYACQITNLGYGVDLGDVLGFRALSDDLRGGVTVEMTHGEMCTPSLGHPQPYPRQTIVYFTCDPLAGVGTPTATAAGIETGRCSYEFEWRSLYGCPVCSEEDYSFVISDCVDNSRQKLFHWNDNPRRCHDGVSLPAPVSLPCSSPAVHCEPGFYLRLNEQKPDTGVCVPTDPGDYSFGGGDRYDTWDKLPTNLIGLDWTLHDEFIRSSTLGDSKLIVSAYYVENGYIEFTYKVINPGDATAKMYFYMDDIPVSEYGSTSNYRTAHISVKQGQRVFAWKFVGGNNERYVNIRSITMIGTRFAAQFPLVCPPGTYSSVPSSTSCSVCPANTFSHAGYSECIECASDEYSYPGSSSCTPRPACTADDYQLVYGPCTAEGVSAHYELVPPAICQGGYVPPTPSPESNCFPCPPGHYRDSATKLCKTCRLGEYFNGTACQQAKTGSAAIPITGYFTQPETEMPAAFTTTCQGGCISPGWRFRGNVVDSGLHSDKEVDSRLSLQVEFIGEGTLMFEYLVDGSELNGLQVFINAQQLEIPYHPNPLKRSSDSGGFYPISVPVAKGPATLTWNYHQEPGTTGQVILRDIELKGVKSGGATKETQCNPGYYSANAGSSSCDACPPGTFSSVRGSNKCTACGSQEFSETYAAPQCEPCGSLTNSTADHTDCTTDCTYNYGDDFFDLTSLSDLRGPYNLPSKQAQILLNVCQKKDFNTLCLDTDTGDAISTYICELFPRGVGVDFGRVLSVEFKKPKASKDLLAENSDPQILLTYTHGTSGDETCPGDRNTRITLTCDSSVDLFNGPSEAISNDPCTIHLTWNTPYACRVCTDADYEQQESECDGGQQTVAMVKLPTSRCNGPDTKDAVEQKCSREFKFPLIVLIFVGVAFIALGIIIILVVIRNRRIEQKYSLLLTDQSKNIELEDVKHEETIHAEEGKVKA